MNKDIEKIKADIRGIIEGAEQICKEESEQGNIDKEMCKNMICGTVAVYRRRK